jgi:hypothetical protein
LKTLAQPQPKRICASAEPHLPPMLRAFGAAPVAGKARSSVVGPASARLGLCPDAFLAWERAFPVRAIFPSRSPAPLTARGAGSKGGGARSGNISAGRARGARCAGSSGRRAEWALSRSPAPSSSAQVVWPDRKKRPMALLLGATGKPTASRPRGTSVPNRSQGGGIRATERRPGGARKFTTEGMWRNSSAS